MPAFVRLYHAIYGLPRHARPAFWRMIICQNKLSSFVPLENASMPGPRGRRNGTRTIAKISHREASARLGMMSVDADALELCKQRERPGRPGLDLAHIPKTTSNVRDHATRGHDRGVFKSRARAQMATLPRMKPKCF